MKATAAGIWLISTLTIRNVEPAVKNKLRVRAARNGRSMVAELPAIVTDAVGSDRTAEVNLAEAIRRRFAPFGGLDNLVVRPREPARPAPTFD